MAPSVELGLLGTFEVRLDGVPVPAAVSVRAQALLADLVLHRGSALPRERLAAGLWPESSGPQSRTNLRHVLHTLRRILPWTEDQLEVTTTTVRWRDRPACLVDVIEFERLLDIPGDDRLGTLRRAVAVYRGDLLEAVDDPGLTAARTRLRARLAGALTELAERAAAAGAFPDAVDAAERLLRLDPLQEPSYRLLMAVHAARGDRAAALRAYHRCAAGLERELGVVPSAETRAAYAALLPPGEPASTRQPGVRPALVGRAAERARLGAAWRAARAGRPQLVLLTGEAGIGKTRLAEEFRGWCARRGALTATGACYAAEGPLPYGLVASWLRTDAVRAAADALDPGRRADLARLLPDLRTDPPDPIAVEPLPADEQRRRVFEALAAVLARAAGGAPLVLVGDDLQHADPASCRLLHYLLRERTPLLVLGTSVEEVSAGALGELLAALRRREQLVAVPLGGLEPQESAALVADLTRSPLPVADVAPLHERTGGNPLFLLEAVRAGWRPGGRADPPSPRVQAVLEARLAELSPTARTLAEAAAVIGRPFDLDLLVAASGPPDGEGSWPDAVVGGLDELWRHGVVREQAEDAAAGRYGFAHETLRAAARASIGPVRAARLHERVALALTDRLAGGPGEAEVAAHWAAAGLPVRAAQAYGRAAEAAQLLHAPAEAVGLLERALDLLRTVPPSPARDADELALTTALLAPLVSEHGYAAPVLSRLHSRARTLTRTLERPPAPPLLRSLAMEALSRDDFQAADAHARALRAAGAADADGVLEVEADVLLGFAAFWQARLVEADQHLRRAVDHYQPERARTHLARYGQDPRAVALARLGNTAWFLGDPAAARTARASAYAWADEVGHPYTRAAVLLFGSLLALDMADESTLRDGVAALQETRVDALPIRLCGAALGGLVDVLDGRTEAGLRRVDAAIGRAASGAGAPGVGAMLARVRLAACAAGPDPAATATAARALLDAGPAAVVWAAEARRVGEAFLPASR